MSKRRLERWTKKLPEQSLWWCIGLFATVIFAVGLLGGERNMIPFGVGAILTVLASIPLLVVIVLMCVAADREARMAYSLRIALILLFVALKVAWDYAS